MKRAFYLVVLPLALAACPRESALTVEQARASLQEASAASQAENLSAVSVDLSTHFTIGMAAEQAARELQNFLATELPCADVALSGATLNIEYGAKSGNCLYHGHQLSGSSAITVSKDEMNEVVVDHRWTKLSNGAVELDGSARVVWNFQDQTRHVTHEVSWTELASGRSGSGSGDRTQAPLPSGIADGVQVDGSRSWSGKSGTWDLAIDGVQLRWSDPVPQAGSYALHTPYGKTVSMSFVRVDQDTIDVNVAGPQREFHFTVSKTGAISGN